VVNTKAVSRGQNELISEIKMAMGDVIIVMGVGYEVHIQAKGIKRELDLVWILTGKDKLSGLLEEAIGHSF
jgi:hypothetical protein